MTCPGAARRRAGAGGDSPGAFEALECAYRLLLRAALLPEPRRRAEDAVRNSPLRHAHVCVSARGLLLLLLPLALRAPRRGRVERRLERRGGGGQVEWLPARGELVAVVAESEVPLLEDGAALDAPPRVRRDVPVLRRAHRRAHLAAAGRGGRAHRGGTDGGELRLDRALDAQHLAEGVLAAVFDLEVVPLAPHLRLAHRVIHLRRVRVERARAVHLAELGLELRVLEAEQPRRVVGQRLDRLLVDRPRARHAERLRCF
mmetsp:Transcript_6750/g.17648  ORF Transcript_6750/g.17648 Transcript_6750/m.17648 type:complete len:259 (+) Transcript_6750:215-991(+)